MRLTRRLLGWLNKPFNKDPRAFIAFNLDYQGALTWEVSNGTLTTTVAGGPGDNLSVVLSGYTIGTLIAHLAAQPGYSVIGSVRGAQRNLSAIGLIDAKGSNTAINGTQIKAYTSLLWAILDAAAAELYAARKSIQAMPAQMVTWSSTGEFLELLGTLFKVPRNPGELDTSYGPRIAPTVLLQKCNNFAIAAILEQITGQTCSVVDVVEYVGPTGANLAAPNFANGEYTANGQITALGYQTTSVPTFNGAYQFNGAIDFNDLATVRYGLFDVQIGYNLLTSGDQSAFVSQVTSLVSGFRAIGTQLRSVSLQASGFSDPALPGADGDTSLTVVTQHYANGVYMANGSIYAAGYDTTTAAIDA